MMSASWFKGYSKNWGSGSDRAFPALRLAASLAVCRVEQTLFEHFDHVHYIRWHSRPSHAFLAGFFSGLDFLFDDFHEGGFVIVGVLLWIPASHHGTD